ncbi:MAG: hypothetical protein ACPIOQ_08995 [Promethearchaeia archaeon]
MRPGVLRGVEDIAIRARRQKERGTASRSCCGEPPEQPSDSTVSSPVRCWRCL